MSLSLLDRCFPFGFCFFSGLLLGVACGWVEGLSPSWGLYFWWPGWPLSSRKLLPMLGTKVLVTYVTSNLSRGPLVQEAGLTSGEEGGFCLVSGKWLVFGTQEASMASVGVGVSCHKCGIKIGWQVLERQLGLWGQAWVVLSGVQDAVLASDRVGGFCQMYGWDIVNRKGGVVGVMLSGRRQSCQ